MQQYLFLCKYLHVAYTPRKHICSTFFSLCLWVYNQQQQDSDDSMVNIFTIKSSTFGKHQLTTLTSFSAANCKQIKSNGSQHRSLIKCNNLIQDVAVETSLCKDVPSHPISSNLFSCDQHQPGAVLGPSWENGSYPSSFPSLCTFIQKKTRLRFPNNIPGQEKQCRPVNEQQNKSIKIETIRKKPETIMTNLKSARLQGHKGTFKSTEAASSALNPNTVLVFLMLMSAFLSQVIRALTSQTN